MSWSFVVFLGSCRYILRYYLILDTSPFVPHPFHVFIHFSAYKSTVYSFWCWQHLSKCNKGHLFAFDSHNVSHEVWGYRGRVDENRNFLGWYAMSADKQLTEVSKDLIAFFFSVRYFLWLLKPEDEDITIIRRVGKFLSVDMAQRLRKLDCSAVKFKDIISK